MDSATAREIASQAADKAVSQALLKLGIDTEDPKSVIEFQRDLGAIRELARTMRSFRTQAIIAVLMAAMFAAIGALWVGFKAALK